MAFFLPLGIIILLLISTSTFSGKFKLSLYEKLKLTPHNYVVVLTGDDKKNLKVCKLLREELGHEKIISRSGDMKIIQHLKMLAKRIHQNQALLIPY